MNFREKGQKMRKSRTFCQWNFLPLKYSMEESVFLINFNWVYASVACSIKVNFGIFFFSFFQLLQPFTASMWRQEMFQLQEPMQTFLLLFMVYKGWLVR